MKQFALIALVVSFLGLARTTQADTINLAWNPNTEADLAGYVVSYGTTANTYTSTFDSGNNTSQPLANLVKGTRYYFSVKAYNMSGVYSGASQEVSGVASDVPPSPPTAPAGPTPASGATGVSLTPTLSWAASTRATQYAVAFGTTTPPPVVASSQPSTTYQPGALTGSTTYYWRIVATGAGGSTSGPIWSLTTAAPGSVVPVASYAFDEGSGTTTLDASGNGRTGTLTNATWTTAGRYGRALSFNGSSSRVTVADAAALHLSTAMTLEAWVNPSGTGVGSWQAFIYKGQSVYFLAIPEDMSEVTAGGTIGGGLALVTRPNVLAANTWAHVAVTYDGSMVRLFVNGTEVATQPATGLLAVSTTPLEIGGTATDGGAFAGLIDDVRVYDIALTAAQIQTDMSRAVGSPTDTQAPTAPTTLTATAVSSTQLSLSWTASTDTVGVTGYRLERCAGAGCTPSALGPVTTTSYIDSLLVASTSYTYRVRAIDAAGNLSSYSSSASATTLNLPTPPAPTAPSGPTPVSGATGVSGRPTLSWAASTNATQYDVAFGTTNPPAVVSSSQTATTYQPAALIASKKYFWRIVAKGAGGSTSGPVWSLTTQAAPTAPSGPTPVSGATGVSLTPTLSWAASTNATQYDVAFGTTNPPAVVSSSQTARTYQPAALIASKKYFWRIVAKGAGGSTSGPVWSLTTTTAAARPAPIAVYSFNDGAGTTAGDASGNGRTGTLTDATWTTAGKYGGALSFNGSSSRVTVADAALLHLSTAMTLEAWVNPAAAESADWQALIYKAYDVHFLATLPGTASVPTSGGTVAGGLVQVTGPSGLPAQTWTHVATTYDGATMRLFVNGAQVASRPATGRLDDSSSPLEIGGSATDGGPFAGLIDDVRIYNTSLTAAQIRSDMATPIASAPAASEAPVSSAASASQGVTDQPVATSGPAARASSDRAEGALAPLRLLTWNINGGNNRAGAANVDAQVALMVSSGAQVMALQGVTISTAADLSSLYQWTLEAATGRSWNALWIPAPLALAPALPDGHLLLSLLPIANAATTVFDSAPMNPTLRDAKRAAGWIAVVVNGVTLHIATTQLAFNATQRDAQLTQLDGWIATIPSPRLIGGDFQLHPTDAAYGQLASRFSDVWTAIGKPGPGLTQTVLPSQAGRFDYWFSEQNDPHATPTNIWVIETSRSTHHAVVIDVTVQ